MYDKNFCLSSYIAFRYIYKDDVDFFPNTKHENYKLPNNNELTIVSTAKEIDDYLKNKIDAIYDSGKTVGVLLSGGMDSAIIASYMRPGSHAYTFTNEDSDIYNSDIERAKCYCKKIGLKHHLINIDFDDYKKYTPIVMNYAGSPVHSIEPQIYKAAMQAKKDGVDIMLIGDAADYIFGGMDKLLSKDWKFDEFAKRYILLEPELVLKNPRNIREIFEPYRLGNDMIDFEKFISNGPMAIESYGSYKNAFDAAGLEFCDPYEKLKMPSKLDLKRIRNGESKYLIRELYEIRYPEFTVPDKIPMPRPVDKIFANWEGPIRSEFRKDIPIDQLSGNQKWQLWCAEQFLNAHDKE
ncbi:asparagine synthase [Candidatus Saccharibacteria bacterium]|nr:asparagine synthase [Candidatus Saccharibacteria bacterium]